MCICHRAALRGCESGYGASKNDGVAGTSTSFKRLPNCEKLDTRTVSPSDVDAGIIRFRLNNVLNIRLYHTCYLPI